LFAFAQPFEIVNIKDSGIDEKRINLIILSDGYQTTELDKFINDATSFSNAMFAQSPFNTYSKYFNVYAIKVPSVESGADHPANASDTDESGVTPEFYDTYFNSTFDSYGFHRFLYYEIDGNNANNTHTKIVNLLASHFPLYDQALILVNTLTYGGTGGQFPIASASADGNETAIHELGHSMFDLKDEYFQGEVYAAEAINMTKETDPAQVRWKNWIGENSVGVYQHKNIYTNQLVDWYKPHKNCKMEILYRPFCSVCKEAIIEKIHDLVTPIDSYLPNPNTVNNPSFPLDFQLNLIDPSINSLIRTWTLNASNLPDDGDHVSLLENDLTEGINTLTVIVNDESADLKVDNHESHHVYTTTWTINYSTLGIEYITSDTNNYKISLFPIPTNSIINLKVEGNNASKLKAEIIGLDGKHILSVPLSNYSNSEIDISHLSSGVYLTKIYADNIVIANKRIVKN
jgi:hypothetical protein